MKTQQHILHVAKITRICALQETQSIGIHDILNAKGLQCILGQLCVTILYSKAKGWIEFFSYVECSRSKDFSMRFSEKITIANS